MQVFTADLMRPESQRDPIGVAQARDRLLSTYAMINDRLDGRYWVAGDTFSMADCAAAPALFYAVTYVAPLPQHKHLTAYIDRLMDHSSVARTIDQARPYFKFYPGRDGLSRRYFDPANN
jgi:glutathione S-transferase